MKILHVDEQTGWRGGEQQASWLIEELAGRGIELGIAGRPGSAFMTSEHGGVALERFELDALMRAVEPDGAEPDDPPETDEVVAVDDGDIEA